MPVWLKVISPFAGAAALGVAISIYVVNKHPDHARKVAAGAWVVAGAAIGTAIAPGLGTLIGAGVGALIAWWTY